MSPSYALIATYRRNRSYGSRAASALHAARCELKNPPFFNKHDSESKKVPLPGGFYLKLKVEYDQHAEQPWESMSCFGEPKEHRNWRVYDAPRESVQERNERLLRGEFRPHKHTDHEGETGGWVHLTGNWWYPQQDALRAAVGKEFGCDPRTAWQSVQSERDYFKRWLKDEWHYLGVLVTLYDAEDEEIGHDSCWGIDDPDYAVESVANDLAYQLIEEHKDTMAATLASHRWQRVQSLGCAALPA
jgi:hypothetical protein